MRNHIAFKFTAIVLCSVFLFCALVSGFGIAVLVSNQMYSTSPDEELRLRTESTTSSMAYDIAQRYAVLELSNCPEELIYDYYGTHILYAPDHYSNAYSDQWFYSIQDEKGKLLEADGKELNAYTTASHTLTVDYFHIVDQIESSAYESEEYAAVTEPTMAPDEGIEETMVTMPGTVIDQVTAFTEKYEGYSILETYDYETETFTYYAAEVRQSPMLTVSINYVPSAFTPDYWNLFELFWTYRYKIIWVFAGSLLLFAICAVYLCCVAGRKPGSEEVRPAGFNCIPLDIYGLCTLGGILLLLAIASDSTYWFDTDRMGYLAFLAAEAFAGSFLIVAFCYACAAQFKAPGLYWLRRSAVGLSCIYGWKFLVWCWNTFIKFCAWLDAKLPPVLSKIFGTLWRWTKTLCVTLWNWLVFLCRKAVALLEKGCDLLFQGMGRIGHYIGRMYSLLPLTWQWLLTAFLMIFLLYLAFASYSAGWLLFGLGLSVAIVLYGANCFGILLESAKRMSKGDLDTKVSDQFLTGSFKEFAGDLNALADVAVIAAQKQMKSERMKAELVTNVSHDIKTPLTSIINYVDLLQKAQSQEEAEEYLEVLDRQSQRLKKLIEDLMEMSKATTGNIAVEIRQVDAVEAINQALGEFSDKLAAAQLSPIFKQPEQPVMMLADGRLAWRVLSNLLSNAVKYALPGTRLYIDLVTLEGKVLISLKNISKEQLNVSSDELMERFVRGDASRNTEGSGLGLNIAKSLMDLQHGQLQLLVDGDLFKATLIFPASNT